MERQKPTYPITEAGEATILDEDDEEEDNDDASNGDKDKESSLQGPMNWRKTLRHVKSRAQQEIKETEAQEGRSSPRTSKDRKHNRDERMEEGKGKEKLRPTSGTKRDPADKKTYRQMLGNTGIPRRRPISPGNGNAAVNQESAFTRQVVRDPNARPVSFPTAGKRRSTGSSVAPRLMIPGLDKKSQLFGPGMGRRTPSPNTALNQLGSATCAQRKRVEKVLKARLYLLQQTGPNSFMIGGDSPDHKFRVIIGPQNCSCGRGPHCVHLLFVMLRVFQVPESDPCLWSKTLKNYEVESLFRLFHARRSSRIQDLKKSRMKVARPQTPEGEAAPKEEEEEDVHEAAAGETKEHEDEDTCPICLLEMVDGESLVECTGCQNKLHHHCISIWFAECRHMKEQHICPLCRAEWTADTDSFTSESSRSPSGETTSPGSPEVPPNTRASSPQTIPPQASPQASNMLLPHTEPIPPEQKELAAPWIEVLGEELVSCLLSRNWNAREAGLRHMGRVAIGVLLLGVGEGRPGVQISPNRQAAAHKMLTVCLDVLGHLCTDPVYKVFVAALRTLRIVLGYTPCRDESQQSRLQTLLKPFVYAILLKCSDGNRRTSQLSLSTLIEICKGQDGELAVGREIVTPGASGLGGVEYVLACVTQEYEPATVQWQWLLGRLCILDHMLDEFPTEFTIRPTAMDSMGLHHARVMQVLKFALMAVEFPHARVGKLGRRVFLLASRLQAGYRTVFSQILSLLEELGSTMQARMKRRLLAVMDMDEGQPHQSQLLQPAHPSQPIAPCSTPACSSDVESPDDSSPPPSPPVKKMASVPTAAPPPSSGSAGTPDAPPNSPERKKISSPVKAKVSHQEAAPEPSGSDKSQHQGEQSISTLVTAGIKECVAHTMVPPNSPQHGSQEEASVSSSSSEKTGTGPALVSDSTGTGLVSEPRNLASAAGQLEQVAAPGGSTLKLREDVTVPSSLDLSGSPAKLDKAAGHSVSPSKAEKPNTLLFSPNKGEKRTSQASDMEKREDRPISFMLESAYDHLSDNTDNTDADHSSEDSLDLLSQSSPSSPVSGKATCTSSAGGDLSDLMSPATPDDKLVSFKTEVTSHLHQSPSLGETSRQASAEEPCPCKEEVELEEAQALVAALEESERQTTLPFVPGLMDSGDETVTIHVQDPDGNQAVSYVEGLHWERGPVLGTGAFSTCYQARDVKSGILMAVKQISFCRNSVSEQEKVIEAVRDEIKVMAKLNHPNIVRIIGATQQGCHFFMFTEWMPGGSLAFLLDQYGSFSEPVMVSYTQQILRGIAHLHDHQILHRDLKGANVLVDSTGQRIRIADFGAAARLASKTTGAGEFQGQLLGTIAFMAPEVLRGESYGRKCDIWSIGCCMIEMATSKPPWGASDVSNHLALIFKIASSLSPPPIPENLTPAVRDLMLRCLEADRADRPPARDLLKHPLFQMHRKT